jgi:hypothetical protein
MRWVQKVQLECEEAGFTFKKREDNGHWEMYDGCKMLVQNRSLGDLLSKVGNDMGIGV